MRKHLTALFLSAIVLAGCGSNLNPANWFDGDQSTTLTAENNNPLIPDRRESAFRRPPDVFEGTTVDTITDLSVERVPGGVIIRTTGQVARFGAYDVQLTPLDPDDQPVDGVLSYALQAERSDPIPGVLGVREVTAAVKRTDQQLGDTRTIRVEGLQNALERRR